jgi:hypothetical protein
LGFYNESQMNQQKTSDDCCRVDIFVLIRLRLFLAFSRESIQFVCDFLVRTITLTTTLNEILRHDSMFVIDVERATFERRCRSRFHVHTSTTDSIERSR